MGKIDVDRLCRDFESCLGWPYKSPGGTGRDCSRTGIDCSGMFVRAYKLQGAYIYHGSNTIWRKHLSAKGRLTQEGQLERGMAVFKHKARDTQKYPDGQGDFSHIGLVTGVKPLRIVHASTEGMQVKTDTSIGKWSHWGKLSAADYGTSVEASSRQGMALPPATVAAPDGNPVKLRAKPTTKSKLYWLVPDGSAVEVLEEGKDWWRVRWGGKTGYMREEFLARG